MTQHSRHVMYKVLNAPKESPFLGVVLTLQRYGGVTTSDTMQQIAKYGMGSGNIDVAVLLVYSNPEMPEVRVHDCATSIFDRISSSSSSSISSSTYWCFARELGTVACVLCV